MIRCTVIEMICMHVIGSNLQNHSPMSQVNRRMRIDSTRSTEWSHRRHVTVTLYYFLIYYQIKVCFQILVKALVSLKHIPRFSSEASLSICVIHFL